MTFFHRQSCYLSGFVVAATAVSSMALAQIESDNSLRLVAPCAIDSPAAKLARDLATALSAHQSRYADNLAKDAVKREEQQTILVIPLDANSNYPCGE